MYTYYHTPAGLLRISENGAAITHILWIDGWQERRPSASLTPLLKQVILELNEYFAGRRRTFDLPLAPEGTEYQMRTWQALREIPYGETRSYKQIAEAIGSPSGARSVGTANNRNPISILIPCHRVIGSTGRMVGYAGGSDAKRQLLNLERANKDS